MRGRGGTSIGVAFFWEQQGGFFPVMVLYVDLAANAIIVATIAIVIAVCILHLHLQGNASDLVDYECYQPGDCG